MNVMRPRLDRENGSVFRRRDEHLCAVTCDRDTGGQRNVREYFKRAGRLLPSRAQNQHTVRTVVPDIEISRAIERDAHGLNELNVLAWRPAPGHATDYARFAARGSGN